MLFGGNEKNAILDIETAKTALEKSWNNKSDLL